MRWLLLPLNAIYLVVLFFRNLYFYFLKPNELPGFVISVGNIEYQMVVRPEFKNSSKLTFPTRHDAPTELPTNLSLSRS